MNKEKKQFARSNCFFDTLLFPFLPSYVTLAKSEQEMIEMKIAVMGGTPVDSRLGYVVENKFFINETAIAGCL